MDGFTSVQAFENRVERENSTLRRINLPRKSNILALALLAATFQTAALADISGTVTLSANTTLNLDTGATSSSGGDVLWNGSTLSTQASATSFNFFTSGSIGSTQYANLTQTTVTATPASLLMKTSYSTSVLAVGDIFVVKTNGGNYAKLLVTADSAGSLGLQYTTYGAASGGGGGGSGPAPTITAVENAATNISPGLPNAGIAQGSLFVVKGTNLGPAAVVVASIFPLPTTAGIGGTTATVTVGSTTVNAIMY
jgi:hypothetical protein